MLATDHDIDATSGLDAVFMLHRGRLTQFLRARCRGMDSAEAEDIVQELWLRCSKTDIRAISDPKSYLYRMANNLVMDRLRRLERGRRCEMDWGYVNARVEGSAEDATAERDLIAREKLAVVERALKKVGARAALILRRYRIDGVNQAGIAAELGVSLSTVEKDLRKAYEALLAAKKRSDEE